jgi:glycosyltransferase involved in cell wall biosynthesis
LKHEESALYVPAHDPQALAAAARRGLLDSALRSRLENGASEVARLYTWDHIAAQTVDAFAAALRPCNT